MTIDSYKELGKILERIETIETAIRELREYDTIAIYGVITDVGFTSATKNWVADTTDPDFVELKDIIINHLQSKLDELRDRFEEA